MLDGLANGSVYRQFVPGARQGSSEGAAVLLMSSRSEQVDGTEGTEGTDGTDGTDGTEEGTQGTEDS